MSKKHKNGKKTASRKRKSGFGAFLLCLIVFGLLAAGARYLAFEPVKVTTDAMQPAYEQGDIVLINKLADVGRLTRGDLVYASFSRDSARLIRWVAGVAGDLVDVREDGKFLVPADGSDEISLGEAPALTYGEIPANTYLLLCLNEGARDAVDSRELGLVLKRSLIGTPIRAVWPLSRLLAD